MNVTIKKVINFTAITTVEFNVVGGAAGWIDTDVSATTGTRRDRAWCIVAVSAADQDAGVRENGVATVPTVYCQRTLMLMSQVSVAGHLDLYRNVADIAYRIVGYLS